jgi:hypothetical protein
MATQGNVTQGERDLDAAVQLAREMTCPYLEARALFAWGNVCRNRDNFDRARAHLKEAHVIFARLGARPYLNWTEQILGILPDA